MVGFVIVEYGDDDVVVVGIVDVCGWCENCCCVNGVGFYVLFDLGDLYIDGFVL